MKKMIFILFFTTLFCQAQSTDSLNILKKNDWHTLQWFDKDTVYLLPRVKIKELYTKHLSDKRKKNYMAKELVLMKMAN